MQAYWTRRNKDCCRNLVCWNRVCDVSGLSKRPRFLRNWKPIFKVGGKPSPTQDEKPSGVKWFDGFIGQVPYWSAIFIRFSKHDAI